MADVLTLAVRYAHILSAIVWIGALAFSVMVLRAALGRVSLPARKEVLRQLVPIMIRVIPASAVLTIGFGAVLYLALGNYDPSLLWGTTWGLVLLAALILTLGLFAFALGVSLHAAKRIVGHLEEEACSHGAEVGRLQQTFNRSQVIGLVWGLGILVLMVIATEPL